MKLNTCAGLLPVCLFVAACGGGDSTSSGSTNRPYEVIAATGAPDVATFDTSSGSAVPVTVNIGSQTNTLTRVTAGQPIFTDGSTNFLFASTPDGLNYAYLTYTQGGFGVPDDYYRRIGSPPPSSGTATYSGAYFGVLSELNAAGIGSVTGQLSMTANFDADTVSAVVTGRNTTLGAGYDTALLTTDINFAGTVNVENVSAAHNTANSTGNLQALIHGTGAVGDLTVTHFDADVAGNQDLIEWSTFAIE